jgi:hypothetical protein
VGSGDGIANECDPFPANTTNATITQCNGSANGGTLVQLKCTATGTTPASHGVTVNQCNGSANGGGALVICSTNISNNRIAVAAAATPTTSGSSRSTPTGPPTDTVVATDIAPTSPTPILFVGLSLLAFAFVGRRLSRTGSR